MFDQKRWEPYRGNIALLDKEGLVTTDRALFVYGMFLEWDESHETKYSQFRRRVRAFRSQYDEYVGIGQSGDVHFNRRPQGDMAERLGVAGALTVASNIFEVTDADFKKIRQTSRAKTFDYALQLTALGPGYELEIEAKGTHDGKSTSAQVEGIRQKKTAAPSKRKTLRLGVVTDLATTPEHASKITLVDPPEEGEEEDLSFDRLMNRLEFYLRRLRLLTAHGRITVALANRINDLRRLRGSWRSLNRVELVGPEGNRLPVERLPGISTESRLAPRVLVQLRPHPLAENEVSGRTVLCYVHGLERYVLKALIVQDFDEILQIRSEPKYFELEHPDLAGFLVVLPSGIVGGFANVTQNVVRKGTEPEDATPPVG